MKSSISDKIFYHIYPLGMCGAPFKNDFSSPAGDGLKKLIDRIPHLLSLGVNAVYIGPLFESTAHGYDTLDYWYVDRRLGTNEDLSAFVSKCHENGIAVVLDAVLNHTGRHFFAFKELQEKGTASVYKDWYKGVDFGKKSPAGDNFSYEGWSGNYDLAKLNTQNPAVREHLFGAVKHWIEDFGIDGLRLDAADVLESNFMDDLESFCLAVKSDFWLLGEVVHGDYSNWARPRRLDSVTNYELYKGLWSSFNDHNFFEISWTLNRQFGTEGLYKHLYLYNFVENHDVNRLASVLHDTANIFSVYALLFTVPGIPSIYYGGEWGLRGIKKNGSDAELRPPIYETIDHGASCGVSAECKPLIDSLALENRIRILSRIRKEHPALRSLGYRQLHVSSDQFVFSRYSDTEEVIVAVNAANQGANVTVSGLPANKKLIDLLDGGYSTHTGSGNASIAIPGHGVRILA